MAQTVQEVLQRKKLPKEYPPTMLDVKTRDKHVPESVDYNIEHFHDHGENVLTQLHKLHQTNPAKAHKYAEKSCKAVEKTLHDIEQYKTKECKECKIHG
jgi:hypothetical protein